MSSYDIKGQSNQLFLNPSKNPGSNLDEVNLKINQMNNNYFKEKFTLQKDDKKINKQIESQHNSISFFQSQNESNIFQGKNTNQELHQFQFKSSNSIKICKIPEWLNFRQILYSHLKEYGNVLAITENSKNHSVIFVKYDNKKSVEKAFKAINTHDILGVRLKASYYYNDLNENCKEGYINQLILNPSNGIMNYQFEKSSSSGSSSNNANSRSQSKEKDSRNRKLLKMQNEKMKMEIEKMCDEDKNEIDTNNFMENFQIKKSNYCSQQKQLLFEKWQNQNFDSQIIIPPKNTTINYIKNTSSEGYLKSSLTQKKNIYFGNSKIHSDNINSASGSTSARDNSLILPKNFILTSSFAQIEKQDSNNSSLNLTNVRSDPINIKHHLILENNYEDPTTSELYCNNQIGFNSFSLKNFAFNSQLFQAIRESNNVSSPISKSSKFFINPISSNRNSEAFQEIDIYKILNNQDFRTTVMIKNIPNKYDQITILKLIDNKGLKRKYDLFYMPIDFEKKGNYGYAFINFVDSVFVVNFFLEINGKKWDNSNSSKVCELRYANIQGKTELLIHFNNSSIMNQKEKKFKPKVMININHPSLSQREDMIKELKKKIALKISGII